METAPATEAPTSALTPVEAPAAPATESVPDAPAETSESRAARLGLIDTSAEPAPVESEAPAEGDAPAPEATEPEVPAEPESPAQPELPQPSAEDYWRQTVEQQRQIREYKTKVREYEQLVALAQRDPSAAGQQLGVTLDRLLEQAAGGTPAPAQSGDNGEVHTAPEVAELVKAYKETRAELDELKSGLANDKKETVIGSQTSIIRGLADAAGARFVLAEGAERQVLDEASKLVEMLGWQPQQVHARRDEIYTEVIKQMDATIREEKRAERERLNGLFGETISAVPAPTLATPPPPAETAPTLGATPPAPTLQPKADEDLTDEDLFAILRQRRDARRRAQNA